MKILIDTNILFSAILNENSRVAKALFYANEHHELYLSEQNIYEIKEVVSRKVPRLLPVVDKMLKKIKYKVIPVNNEVKHEIRDAKDQPILNAAIKSDLDIILTGDKDFLALNLKRPKCMDVAEFCREEGIED